MQPINEKIVSALPVPKAGNKVHFFSGSTLQGKKATSERRNGLSCGFW